MGKNSLKLNPGNLLSIHEVPCCHQIPLIDSQVHNLGVFLDLAFFSVTRNHGQGNLAAINHNLITTHLDYCNALY